MTRTLKFDERQVQLQSANNGIH